MQEVETVCSLHQEREALSIENDPPRIRQIFTNIVPLSSNMSCIELTAR